MKKNKVLKLATVLLSVLLLQLNVTPLPIQQPTSQMSGNSLSVRSSVTAAIPEVEDEYKAN